MELKQNANTCVILLHEIYGINEHISDYAQLFFENGFDVNVPNMLNRSEPFTYEEEALAYEHFMTNVGFIKAKAQINDLIVKIANEYEHIRIIGFSIGATIGWLCSENVCVQKVVGFYGSRIRQYTEIKPTAETILIYGDKETSFNPADLKASLCLVSNVDVKIVEGLHGFADPYSINYNQSVTNSLIECLMN